MEIAGKGPPKKNSKGKFKKAQCPDFFIHTILEMCVTKITKIHDCHGIF